MGLGYVMQDCYQCDGIGYIKLKEGETECENPIKKPNEPIPARPNPVNINKKRGRPARVK